MRAFHLFPAILPQETSTGATVTSPWNQSSAPTDTHSYTRFSAGLCNMCSPSCVNIIQNRKQIWTYWFILQPKSLAQEHFHTVFLLCRFLTHLIILIILISEIHIRLVLCRRMRVKPIWIEPWSCSSFFLFSWVHLHPSFQQVSVSLYLCVVVYIYLYIIYDHRDFAIISTFCWSWNNFFGLEMKS